MRKEDAAKILGISGEMTKEIIKKAYRAACMKYHPDRNPAGEEMMKAVNLAYETLQDFEGNLESGAEGYDEAMMEVLNKLKELHGIVIEVCGSRGNWSLDDIRTHHGSQVIKGGQKSALAYN